MRLVSSQKRHKARYLNRNTPRHRQWSASHRHILLIEEIKNQRVIKGMSYGPKSDI